jgi:UDP-N-acetylglucosamine kinase
MNKLSPDEYQDYKDDVFGFVFTDQKAVDEPKAFIFSGQPGAGKTGLKNAVEEFLKQSGETYVVIDPDDYRSLHPKYEQYNREDDKKTAERTHTDASQVADEVREKAVSEKYNLIIDGTLKNKSKALALVEKLKENGYEVHLRAICVPPAVSWQGCLDRYQRDKGKPPGHGRFVPQEIHDDAVNSMVFSIVEIERQGLADSSTVQNRQGTIYHKSYPAQNDERAQKEAIRNIVRVYVEYGERQEILFEELPEIRDGGPIQDLIDNLREIIKNLF